MGKNRIGNRLAGIFAAVFFAAGFTAEGPVRTAAETMEETYAMEEIQAMEDIQNMSEVQDMEATEDMALQPELELKLEAEQAHPKAGEAYFCRAVLSNPGEAVLTDIELSASFEGRETKIRWEPERKFCAEGDTGILDSLYPGETGTFIFVGKLTEDGDGMLTPKVTAKAHCGEDTLVREAALPVVVQPLAAAFEVKKTADCREALPGDRITYQIAIHNTGERTLHSVLTTERFLHSNIRAAFLETEGVSLNGTKTQASIPAITPGGCVCLKAVVVLPEELKEQELINQVIVTTEETGEEEAVHAQAEIKVREKTAGGGGAAVRRSQIYRSSSPKTGDDTPRRIFEILMLLSVLASAGAARRLFLQRKEKSRH